MELTEELRGAVERVIRDRFAGKVENIEIEAAEGEKGEDVLRIRVVISRNTTVRDFAGRFFGLTGRVRNALGDDMRGVFPVIRPVEAHA